jgi:hypothetical protein
MSPSSVAYLDRRRFIASAAALSLCPSAHAEPQAAVHWIDRLDTPGTSDLGTQWSAITDGVMGGLSDLKVTVERIAETPCYRMRGRVRTANNGGFVQMALPLALSRRGLDARPWTGLRLRVRGNGEAYALHLRTTEHRMPWDYHSTDFVAGPEWTEIDVPFSQFKRSTGGGPVDTQHLLRLALVGIGRDFQADLALASVALYAAK